MAQNKCGYPGCAAMKDSTLYACRRHWWMLPKNIREGLAMGYKSSRSQWVEADRAAKDYWSKHRPSWDGKAQDHAKDCLLFVRGYREMPFKRPSHLELMRMKGRHTAVVQIRLADMASLATLVGHVRQAKRELEEMIKQKMEGGANG